METTTLSGLIATTPRHLVTLDGLPITSFRLAVTQRKFSTEQGKWVDAATNWYTITAFRQLATHMSESFSKGDRILVTGQLIIRDWDNGDRAGTSVEVEATSAGHDLAYGTSIFERKTITRDPIERLGL